MLCSRIVLLLWACKIHPFFFFNSFLIRRLNTLLLFFRRPQKICVVRLVHGRASTVHVSISYSTLSYIVDWMFFIFLFFFMLCVSCHVLGSVAGGSKDWHWTTCPANMLAVNEVVRRFDWAFFLCWWPCLDIDMFGVLVDVISNFDTHCHSSTFEHKQIGDDRGRLGGVARWVDVG